MMKSPRRRRALVVDGLVLPLTRREVSILLQALADAIDASEAFREHMAARDEARGFAPLGAGLIRSTAKLLHHFLSVGELGKDFADVAAWRREQFAAIGTQPRTLAEAHEAVQQAADGGAGEDAWAPPHQAPKSAPAVDAAVDANTEALAFADELAARAIEKMIG